MKPPVAKAFTALLITILFTGNLFAFSDVNPEDTSRKLLMASVVKKNETVVVLKEANVKFPAILAGNEAESIEYVEKFSKSRKEYLIRTYKKSKILFPKAAVILKKYKIPEEFKILLALESGFNGNAVSTAGAVGYWQFMDEVAKEYGLKITEKSRSVKTQKTNKALQKQPVKKGFSDERKNFVKSTHAAAKYLKDRCRNLNNDWLLIAASYNWGVGNVWNAMEKTGKLNPTFWDIKKYVPAETRAYVMNFIAMNVVFHNYDNFSKNKLCFKQETCKAEVLFNDLPFYIAQTL